MLVTKDRNGFGNDSHCVLLTHGDEVLSGSPETFMDVSNSASTHTCHLTGSTVNTVEQDKTDGVFDNSCWSVTGHSSLDWGYIRCSDNERDWDFGRDDFCIDYWVKPLVVGYEWDSVYGSNGVYLDNVSGGNYFGFAYDNGRITSSSGWTFLVKINGVNQVELQSGVTLEMGTWYHVAVTRCVSTFRFFLDGRIIDTQESTGSMPSWGSSDSKGYLIGAAVSRDGQDLGSFSMTAKYDEFRITKGEARWTSEFTLPNRKY